MVGQLYSRKNAPKKKKPRVTPENPADRVFVPVKFSAPRSVEKKLKKIAEEREWPMSKLILTAIHNEFDEPNAFELNTDFPDMDITENQYTLEASKLLDFIEQFPEYGTGPDTMIFCREEIGIGDDITVLLALKSLIEQKMVEPIIPRLKYFRYPKEYRYYRMAKWLQDHRENERRMMNGKADR